MKEALTICVQGQVLSISVIFTYEKKIANMKSVHRRSKLTNVDNKQ